SAATEHDGVEVLAQFRSGQILAHLAARHKLDALLYHEVDASLNRALVQLHVRDAVHKQPADTVGPLEDGDPMAGTVELLRCRQARRTGADDRHLLAGALGRRLGHDPAFLEALVDDGALDALDGDRLLVDAEDAGALARRRTHTTGELGKVVCL